MPIILGTAAFGLGELFELLVLEMTVVVVVVVAVFVVVWGRRGLLDKGERGLLD
jgi:hypothetical protein